MTYAALEYEPELDVLRAVLGILGAIVTRAESAIPLCPRARRTTAALTLRNRLIISWASAARSTSGPLLMCIATPGAFAAGGIASFRCPLDAASHGGRPPFWLLQPAK